MTVVFGSLTTQFTTYSLAVAEASTSPEGAARLVEASAALNAQINKNVLYLVYIGELALLLSVEVSVLTSSAAGIAMCQSARAARRHLLATKTPTDLALASS